MSGPQVATSHRLFELEAQLQDEAAHWDDVRTRRVLAAISADAGRRARIALTEAPGWSEDWADRADHYRRRLTSYRLLYEHIRPGERP